MSADKNPLTRKRLAAMLDSAATALRHGRTRSAREKVEKVFDTLDPGPLVIDVSGGVVQDVYTIRDGARVPVEHALVDWDVLTGDGSDQVSTARAWVSLPDVVTWYLEKIHPESVADVRRIINPPPPEPQPESLVDAARNALDVLDYTLTDCAEDDESRMGPAAKRLRAAITREENRRP